MKKLISVVLSVILIVSVFLSAFHVYAAEHQYDDYAVKGIDVSYYNEGIDWEQVKSSGVEFVMIRAGLRGYGEKGVLAPDRAFEANLAAANEAGLKIGVYFFSQALTPAEAKEEAKYLIQLLEPYREWISMPVAMDYEFMGGSSGRLTNAWNQKKVNKAALTINAAVFCRAVENAGYQAMVYANKSFLENQLDVTFLQKHFSIWLAHHTENTNYGGRFHLWQYTQQGQIPGIEANIDIDLLIDSQYPVSHFSGWQKADRSWCYFSAEGEPAVGWLKISNKYYYFLSSGIMQTGWQKIGGKWYYFNTSGAMQTGWQKIGGKWYYFNTSGSMLSGWQKIGGKWYYFNSSGAMQTSWQKIGGKWYYFNASGAMTTGWQKISNKWYYFESSGVMLANTSCRIGGKTYRFNSSGICTNP